MSQYEPYSTDRRGREFMEREGEPCRHCLFPFMEHYNGRCPKSEEDCDD